MAEEVKPTDTQEQPEAKAGPGEIGAAPVAEAGGSPEPAPETVESLKAQCEDLLSRLQRVSADYLNYQKRATRDVATAREYANEQLIRALLPVLDDLDRAMGAAGDAHDDLDPFFLGVQLVRDKMLETLGSFGLEPIAAAGKPFDPALHSAIMEQPSAEHPPRTVLVECDKGYMLRGRTVRPARVVVSTAPPTGAEDRSHDGADQVSE
jgi:molecular chaperone GrpE